MTDATGIHRLGVLSDTHGRAATCARAVEALRSHGCDALVHLGDVGTTAVLEELVGEPPVHVVFGNCDDERSLQAHAERLDLHVHHPLGVLDVAGRPVAFTHGHLPAAVQQGRRDADLLLVGHSHRLGHDADDDGRVANPGALFRAARYTCALVHGERLNVSWIDLGPPP